ncbi:hypothetical protein MYX64_01050 [Nitrospinae bacterium AH_259_B05_G02_I21]|nr:hypothetical protein [Nitrospinae bacterium AH_259_B05_G02_I21]MDA2932411.1 hypothetical protein [Nitrospinae bacterium AH-259-F20]
MDLGIGKLFELIEEYFGKSISRIILGLVALAVCVYSFDIILRRGGWPLFKVISSLDWQIFQENFVEMTLAFGLSVFPFFILMQIVYRYLVRKTEGLNEETKNLYKETVSIHNQSKQEVAIAEKRMKIIEKDLVDVKNKLDEALRFIGLSSSDKEDSQSQ